MKVNIKYTKRLNENVLILLRKAYIIFLNLICKYGFLCIFFCFTTECKILMQILKTPQDHQAYV